MVIIFGQRPGREKSFVNKQIDRQRSNPDGSRDGSDGPSKSYPEASGTEPAKSGGRECVCVCVVGRSGWGHHGESVM